MGSPVRDVTNAEPVFRNGDFVGLKVTLECGHVRFVGGTRDIGMRRPCHDGPCYKPDRSFA